MSPTSNRLLWVAAVLLAAILLLDAMVFYLLGRLSEKPRLDAVDDVEFAVCRGEWKRLTRIPMTIIQLNGD